MQLDFYELIRMGGYLILDTETTGLSNAEIVQIAIINDKGEVLLDTLVKPVKPIPPDATRVHGITNEMVKDAPLWSEIAPKVESLIEDRYLVIYNADFDTAVIDSASRHAGFTFKWTHTQIHCAMEAFAEYHGDWNEYHQSYKWKPLSRAAQYVGMQPDNAHNALSDCKMTLAVCRFLATVKEEDEAESGYEEWDAALSELDDDDY